MKRFYLSFLYLIFSFKLFAQRDHQADKAAIKTVMNVQLQEWNAGNLQGFMNGYWNSPELRFITRKGITYGWQNIFDNYLKSYGTQEKMGNLVFDILSIDLINKENALVVGKWKVTHSDTSAQEGSFTLWFKKINGKWLIVMDHTS